MDYLGSGAVGEGGIARSGESPQQHPVRKAIDLLTRDATNSLNGKPTLSQKFGRSVTLDLSSLAPNLERRADGIWFAQQQGSVSYPKDGNAGCLQVEDRSFWFRHRNRCIVSLVRRFSPDSVFLDIGGGNGYVAKGLIDARISCALVEPGLDGAMVAHARGVDPVICARLEDTGLAPSSIDAAGLFDVLEHIEDDVAALRQVHTLLRPGGSLFLTVPAYQFLYSDDDRVGGHFRRYTLSSLARSLTAAGFQVGYASYMFAPLPPVVFLLRTVPSRLGLRKGVDPDRDIAEHGPGGIGAWVLDRLLAAEFSRIDAGRTLPVGGSCIVVAVRD